MINQFRWEDPVELCVKCEMWWKWSQEFNERGKVLCVFRHQTSSDPSKLMIFFFAIFITLNFSHLMDIILVSNAFDSLNRMIMYTRPTRLESSRNGIWTIAITVRPSMVTWRMSEASTFIRTVIISFRARMTPVWGKRLMQQLAHDLHGLNFFYFTDCGTRRTMSASKGTVVT